MSRVLIVGCGYVGSELARGLVAAGDTVFGVRREVARLPQGVVPLRADVANAEGIGALPAQLDSVVYAIGAKSRDQASYRAAYVDGLRNVLRALREQGQRPRRIVFTSSTAVYGQSRGEWVDEESPTHPRDFAGEILLAAEGVLQNSPIPGVVLRLGGIYGPGRTSLLASVRMGGPVAATAGPHYTNRIHRDDAAGAVAHLLALESPEPLYLGVDSLPADRAEVLAWLADRLGVDVPPGADGRPTRVGSKRCSNRRLRESGYVFLHPTFRDGFDGLIEGGTLSAG